MRNARQAGSIIGLVVMLGVMATPFAHGDSTSQTAIESSDEPEPVALIPLRAS